MRCAQCDMLALRLSESRRPVMPQGGEICLFAWAAASGMCRLRLVGSCGPGPREWLQRYVRVNAVDYMTVRYVSMSIHYKYFEIEVEVVTPRRGSSVGQGSGGMNRHLR
eukprot:XP_001691665.1 predicted protein [Chlamydomonas reinhardtii]